MTREEFFDKFELFAETLDAVVQMRALVLRMAVRGTLVPQDPTEGNAAALLNEIAAQRRRHHDDVELPPESHWHNIPASWVWVTLGRLGDIVGGGTPQSNNPDYFSDKGIPWLTPADLNGFSGKHIFRGRRFITQRGLDDSSARLLPEGSVLFSSRAPIGYVAIAGTEVATNQGFKSCVPFIRDTNEFLYYYLMSAAARIDGEAPGTTFREVSGKLVSQIPVPLPPLAEQKRIVAKVDELMALCDRLEAQQKERDTRGAALARASLLRFLDAPDRGNLNLLFNGRNHTSAADLRATVLTLAINGKLVSQDPIDEPALRSIERIAVLRNNGKAADRPARREINSLAVPSGWVWTRLGDLVLEFRYGTSRKCDRNASGVPVLRIPNLRNGIIDPSDLKYTKMPTAEFNQLRLKPGDLLLIRSNGSEGLIGRSAVATPADEHFAYAGYLVRARLPIHELCSRYVNLALGSALLRDQIEKPIRTTSGVKNINTTELANLVLPLPPLPEQRRIVAKVDRLMTLIDTLEAHLEHSQSTGKNLVEAAVAELTT